MFEDFILRAIVAALAIAVAAGPLGCFVVWRRMAYFGDATAHAAILGVALALVSGTPILLGILVVAVATALIVAHLSDRDQGADAVLGVIAHGSLALGLVAVSLLPGRQPDLMGYLFGDILAITATDVVFIAGGAAVILGVLAWRWQALVTATFSPDLSHAAGQNPKREGLILALLLAVTIALAIKVVGVLLISAMLIIPAATARNFAQTPENMALFAAGLGAGAAVGGPWAALRWDTPVGPTIVVVLVAFFVLASLRNMWR